MNRSYSEHLYPPSRLSRCRFLTHVTLGVVCLCLAGCELICIAAPYFTTFTVRGLVLFTDTEEPAAERLISLKLLKEGETVGRSNFPVPTSVAAKLPVAISTNPDGSFAIVMRNDKVACSSLIFDTPTAVKNPVVPDQMQIRLSIDGCLEEFLIDLTEDTVVDITFPENIIELKDPILVAPCEP